MIEPLELLLSRKSHSKLVAPAPSEEQLAILLKAALRAPDHALLKPWHYRVYQGESLLELGSLLAKTLQHEDPDISDEKLERVKKKPLRAPMVIIASTVLQEHPKVPDVEQILSTGAGIQNLIMAAHFLGIGAMWRTGSLSHSRYLMDLLGFDKNESIAGFIYLGAEEGEKRAVKHYELEDFVTRFN